MTTPTFPPPSPALPSALPSALSSATPSALPSATESRPQSPTLAWRTPAGAAFVALPHRRHLRSAAGIADQVLDEVGQAVEGERAESDVSRINRNAGSMVPVQPLTLRLVQIALDAARTTRGAVDLTIGRAVAEPGSRTDDYRSVRVDRTLVRVGVPDGVRLDLTATATSWAADESARRIQRRYGEAVLVGVGSDLASAGTPSAPWRVEVSETAGTPGVPTSLANGGMATASALGHRWSTPDGTLVHHVLDPRTGAPATGGCRTATVWARTALTARLAGAWALVDPHAAIGWIAERRLSARLVDAGGGVSHLGDWPAPSLDEAA
ncbi:MAG: FAD:protein FMN transferase [Nocardioides sp.]|uniref:FAD:protein FMN transferase n=1 Tax=Nocardioides sp. TaxID=35761 RepID=UPI0039E6D829